MGASDEGGEPLGIAQYDQLNVKEVFVQLSSLDIVQLYALRNYEVQNKGRITILRRIDVFAASRMQASEPPTDVVRDPVEVDPCGVAASIESQCSACGKITSGAEACDCRSSVDVSLSDRKSAEQRVSRVRSRLTVRIMVLIACVIGVVTASIVGWQTFAPSGQHTISALIVSQVESDRFRIAKSGDVCVGDDIDVHAGARVSVVDESGKGIFSGEVEVGLVDRDNGFPACILLLRASVPKAKEYHIRVGRKNGPTYSYQELADEDWSLILGDDLAK